MPKTAISLTLERDNLLWLKARTGAAGLRSVSELLDRLIADARATRRGPVRSVVGTIDIDGSDPRLEKADEAVRSLFTASMNRPLVARETSPRSGARRRPRAKPRA